MTFEFQIAPMPQGYTPQLNTDSENYEPIPNGRIDVEIIEVEAKQTKTGGVQLSFECKVLSREYLGQKISYNTLIYVKGGEAVESLQFRNTVYSICAATGMQMGQFQNSAQILAFFKGKKLNMQIQQEAYINKSGEEKITNRINFIGEIKPLHGAFVASENQTVRNQGKINQQQTSADGTPPPLNVSFTPPHVWEQTQNPVHVAQAPISQGWQPNKPTAQLLDDDIPL